MGDRGAGGLAARKRGHQHHPQHQGTRRSNVPADEVIAVLRADLPVAHQELLFGSTIIPEPNNNHIVLTTDDPLPKIDDVTHSLASAADVSSSSFPRDLVDDDNNLPFTQTLSSSVPLENEPSPITDHLPDIAPAAAVSPPKKIRKSKSTRSPSQPDVLGSNTSLNTTSSSGSRTRSSKHESSPPGAASSGKPRKKRTTPREERPPIEGAAAGDDPLMDIENDPELAEWSKLRCTSERTEVVAEREHRRQNRRCADYPGLAFGRSIFSSDTMMKFNIIRNELHNIMNTQLKRVRSGGEARVEARRMLVRVCWPVIVFS